MESDKTKIEFGSAAAAPRLDYDVNIPAASSYYVWVRGVGFDGNSDSVHLGVNGVAQESAGNIAIRREGVQWSRFSSQIGASATLHFSGAGAQKISLFMRESGTSVDSIKLTTDKAYRPDRETSIPTISLAPSTPSSGRITEGADDGITYTLSRSTTFGDLPVAVSLSGGTAIAGDYTVSGENVDYDATTGGFTITFKGTQTQASFTVHANADTDGDEGDETLTLAIDESSGDSYRVAGGSETTTTINNVVFLNSLAAFDTANRSNSIESTLSDASLYVLEKNGQVTIGLTPHFSTGASVLESGLWEVVANGAIVASGTFAYEPTITLSPGERVFALRGGVDENSNGVLDQSEANAEVVLTIVKVDFTSLPSTVYLNSMNKMSVTVTPSTAAPQISLITGDASIFQFDDGLNALTLVTPSTGNTQDINIFGGNLFGGTGETGVTDLEIKMSSAGLPETVVNQIEAFRFSDLFIPGVGAAYDELASGTQFADIYAGAAENAIRDMLLSVDPNSPDYVDALAALQHYENGAFEVLAAQTRLAAQQSGTQLYSAFLDADPWTLDHSDLSDYGPLKAGRSVNPSTTFDVNLEPILRPQAFGSILNGLRNFNTVPTNPGLIFSEVGVRIETDGGGFPAFNLSLSQRWNPDMPAWGSGTIFAQIEVFHAISENTLAHIFVGNSFNTSTDDWGVLSAGFQITVPFGGN